MEKTPWNPSWIRGGRIEDIAWIGEDVLAWCSGVHIILFDVHRRTQAIFRCTSHANGDGARCISGHSRAPVLAFAEKISHPRIIVLGYPKMARISECSRGPATGYLATAFTSQDQLISVGSYPQFTMTVWSWRTGERMHIVDTFLRDEVGQILRATQLGPTVLAQMGRTCGQLYTWEFHGAGKMLVVKEHEIKLPNDAPIYWAEWRPTSNEPLLAITDKDGHIFLSDHHGSNVRRIILSQRCGVCLDIELPMVSWFRDGIILRTTFCQIRFFRRSGRTGGWYREWYLKSTSKPCILVTHPFRNDRFFYYTREGDLMQIDFPEAEDTPSIKKRLQYGATYRFLDFVYPWCHHLAAMDDSKELAILECYSGIEVARLDLPVNGEVSCQASHPDLPLIVFTTLEGELLLVSIVDPNAPVIVTYIPLRKGPLDLIKFSCTGRHLAVSEKRTGNSYIFSIHENQPYTVKAHVNLRRRISDLLLYETHDTLKLLVLDIGATDFSVGHQLILYNIHVDSTSTVESTEVLDLPGVYRTLWHIPGNPKLLLGAVYLSRQLRLQKLHGFQDILLIDVSSSGHRARVANVYADRNWISTAAFDGLVFVRDRTVRRVVASFATHHKEDFGAVKAMANRNCDVIVTIGYDGSIVAMRLRREKMQSDPPGPPTNETARCFHVDANWYESEKEKILREYASLEPKIRNLLTRPWEQQSVSIPDTQTWESWRAETRAQEESARCASEKSKMLSELSSLRSKVTQLLDSNESLPPTERLPVSAFNLDKAGRDRKLKASRDEREDLRLRIEHETSERNRISDWIKSRFWQPQTVLGRSLFSIYGVTEVTNYPSTSDPATSMDLIQWAQFSREAARRIIDGDTFQPWHNYIPQELQEELSKPVNLHREDERRRMDQLLEEDDTEPGQTDTREDRTMDGTTTHRFLEPSPYYYSQLESYGFQHTMLNNRFLVHDCARLRRWFNNAFDELRDGKEREMRIARERIDRIRHIDSELRSMFGQTVPQVPMYPEWHFQEQPESIIKVLDHEVKAKPYISPSQQEILDKQAAEAERIRRLLAADDFRERALMAMMDGVLEVRWEDVIKIDVPKPNCMLETKPEDYTADDLARVSEYERSVRALLEERERYRRILEADYAKVTAALKEGVERFDGRLDALLQFKVNIQAAIDQLNLRHVRGCLRNFRRVRALREEDLLVERISASTQHAEAFEAAVHGCQCLQEELSAQYETLAGREKTLARRFRAEFSQLGKASMEALERQYKRRPRINLRNVCASDLVELGHRIVSRTQPVYLPPECLEYLKALEGLDSRPGAIPVALDSQDWQQLTRFRRQRIELELKLRAKQSEMMETERAIARLLVAVEGYKTASQEGKMELGENRRARARFEQDAEVQLVLKLGQVEIDLRGDSTDVGHGILIPRIELDSVNHAIHSAGSHKLRSLRRSMSFHRDTLMEEWRHSCLSSELRYLEEELASLKSVKVTKEMQRYYLNPVHRDTRTPASPHGLPEARDDPKRSSFARKLGSHRARLLETMDQIERKRRENERLDRQILEMNVARCEMDHRRDLIAEANHRGYIERKMRMVMRRSDLINRLQDNYAELLALQTEHELLRLRRYPVFEFRTIDLQGDKGNVS